MRFSSELKAIDDRLFCNDLIERAVSAYKQEINDDLMNVNEKEFEEGMKFLSSVLTIEQKAKLSEMEKLFIENINYAFRFAFMRGLYAGFQQYFVQDTTKNPFEDLVINQLLTNPNMKKYIEYSDRLESINSIYHILTDSLDTDSREHVTSIYLGWDNRLYGILWQAFYLGYRYSLSAIDTVEPNGIQISMVEKILVTEHEIGLTKTLSEREHEQSILSRRKNYEKVRHCQDIKERDEK